MKATMAGVDWDVCKAMNVAESGVTIDLKRGRVSITPQAYDAAGKPAAFVSLYSAEHKSVGFRPADPRDALAVLASNRRGRAPSLARQFAAGMLSRRMRADGYSGSIYVPVQWHPDGLLWGDLTMATRRKRQAKGGGA